MISGNEPGFKKISTVNRRVFMLSVAKGLIFFGIIGRLFSLQINENKKYLTLSDKNRLREWRLPPVRGEFLDYFGNTIAGNLKVYQLHVVPEQVEDFKSLMVRLKDILNLSKNELNELIKQKNRKKPWETLIVSENLSWDDFSKINFYLHELSGAKPVISLGRNYPYNESYSHVLGYVSQVSVDDILNNEVIKERNVPGLRVGKIGLEKTFEKELIGTNSIQRFEVNAYGKKINQIDHEEGNKGQSIRLTLDTEVQNLTSELLKERSGSISIMDIYTGEIIAMNSSPSINPNLFLYGIDQEKWNEIQKNPKKPLINKTISGLYAPGSTIKPIVALSALEHDVISPNFTVQCTGKHEFYGQTYHCWKKKGHGFMKLDNAIKQSCDIYFYEVARLLGVDRLNVTGDKFGFGKKSLSEYFPNEKKGVNPSTEWKKRAIGQNWYLGETLINGIGQGYILTTPFQLCLMTAQLANGGYKIKPKILASNNNESIELIKLRMAEKERAKKMGNLVSDFFETEDDLYSPLFRNKENIKFVLNAMFKSTNEAMGTSFRSRIDDPKYRFAGKTGTAQVKKITEEERELELKLDQIPYFQRDHAWYVAFGPYKNPRYALSILVEHGGSGSKAAAPMAKKLFKLLIDRHEMRENFNFNNSIKI